MQQVPYKLSKHTGRLQDEVLLRRYRASGQSMTIVGGSRSRVRKKAEKPAHVDQGTRRRRPKAEQV